MQTVNTSKKNTTPMLEMLINMMSDDSHVPSIIVEDILKTLTKVTTPRPSVRTVYVKSFGSIQGLCSPKTKSGIIMSHGYLAYTKYLGNFIELTTRKIT